MLIMSEVNNIGNFGRIQLSNLVFSELTLIKFELDFEFALLGNPNINHQQLLGFRLVHVYRLLF